MGNEQKQTFVEKGYVIVEDLISATELRELSDMADKLLDGILKPEIPYNGKLPEAFYTFWEPRVKDDPTLPRREKIRLMSYMCHHHPYFQRFAAHPASSPVLSCLFEDGVQVFADTLFVKPAHHGMEASMHQDTAFWPKLIPNAINFWLAIDDATVENGCLYVIPGSHTVDIPHGTDPIQHWILGDDQVDTSRLIPIELKGGSAIFFDSGLVHLSHPNRSDKSRRAMTVVYVSEHVRCVVPWPNEYGFELLPAPPA